MKKVIVTTTINSPTEAIQKFDSMPDWDLVVIGDLKTPKDYRLKRGIYVSPEKQEKYDKQLSDAIGWNCIQRRNFGLLWANDMKADMVAVVDDDNIPMDGWGENLLIGNTTEVNYYETDIPAFDPIGATNHKNLWHRGFPLQLIPSRVYSNKIKKELDADIQADFWNGDPDIDAICRMEHAPDCVFEDIFFPISANKLAPFNSQNTFLKGALLKDYFLFPHVGRMDDIWASFYLQAKNNCKVVYGKASVYQERNPHDLVKDLKQEYLGYENNLKIVQELPNNADALLKYLPEVSVLAFKLYKKHYTR
ncbi:MAG: hypothetical protein JXB49_09005 [Bacteroidales bacterium]|nr:hypothetical protein [Bacteroidales bacterium]